MTIFKLSLGLMLTWTLSNAHAREPLLSDLCGKTILVKRDISPGGGAAVHLLNNQAKRIPLGTKIEDGCVVVLLLGTVLPAHTPVRLCADGQRREKEELAFHLAFAGSDNQRAYYTETQPRKIKYISCVGQEPTLATFRKHAGDYFTITDEVFLQVKRAAIAADQPAPTADGSSSVPVEEAP